MALMPFSGWFRRISMRIRRDFEAAVVRYLGGLGFVSNRSCIIHGPGDRLHLGRGPYPSNAVYFNTRSGHIYIGDDAVLSFNCMFLTGCHEFENGALKQPRSRQVPSNGYDIRIGRGCWIASGAIVTGGVTIGDHCIVAAGAVVTKSFDGGCILAGVPARVIGYTNKLGTKEEVGDIPAAEGHDHESCDIRSLASPNAFRPGDS